MIFEGLCMVGAFAGIVCLGIAKPEQESIGEIEQPEKKVSMSEFEQENAY